MSNHQDKFITAFFWTMLIALFSLVGSCIYQESSVTKQEQEERFHRHSCSSKIRGSRPACWSKRDWEVFCKYVECKIQPEE